MARGPFLVHAGDRARRAVAIVALEPGEAVMQSEHHLLCRPVGVMDHE